MERDLEYFSSYFEVDLTQIKKNIELVRKRIGEGHEIMPVLKGNCYGSGTVEVATAIEKDCHINIFGCAHVFEGIEMRKAGITCDILLLSPPAQHGIKYATHGYSPNKPDYRSVLVISGNEIKNEFELGEVEVVDIAPTVASLLGIEFPNCDGRALLEVLKGYKM